MGAVHMKPFRVQAKLWPKVPVTNQIYTGGGGKGQGGKRQSQPEFAAEGNARRRVKADSGQSDHLNQTVSLR